MSDRSTPPHSTAATDRLSELARAMSNAGLPVDDSHEAISQAGELYRHSGRLDVALERLSSPLMPGGFQRREVISPLFQSAILLLVASSLLYFAADSIAPRFEEFYLDVKRPVSSSVAWLLWSKSLVLPALGVVAAVILVCLLVCRWLPQSSVPRWLPGRRRYLQCVDGYHRARWNDLARPRESELGLLRLHQASAVSMANQWRRGLPLLLGFFLGGAIVLVYSFCIFVPILQLMYDLSQPGFGQQLGSG